MSERVRYVASGFAVGMAAALLLAWPLLGATAPLAAVGVGLVAFVLRGRASRALRQRLVLTANEELLSRLGRSLRWLAASAPVLVLLGATGHRWAWPCVALVTVGCAALCSQRTYALFVASVASLLALVAASVTVVMSLHTVSSETWLASGGPSSPLGDAPWGAEAWLAMQRSEWTDSVLFVSAAWLTASLLLFTCVSEFGSPLLRYLFGKRSGRLLLGVR